MTSLYSDGNPNAIAWGIRTADDTMLERRRQAGIYRGAISTIQAKFMALHVGLFWGIGVFAIRNGDAVQFMIDDPAMLECLERRASDDGFVDGRIRHIGTLIAQRDLRVSVHRIDPSENVASPLLGGEPGAA